MPDLLDQVYLKDVGNLSLPCYASFCLSYAVVLRRWRNAEAELNKNGFLSDE